MKKTIHLLFLHFFLRILHNTHINFFVIFALLNRNHIANIRTILICANKMSKNLLNFFNLLLNYEEI